MFQPNKIIFHHTGDSFNGEQFLKVNQWHKIQQFPVSKYGFFCGYHVFVEKSGKEIIARSMDEIGAHCKSKNQESYGIGLAGNFDFENPTPAQKEALGKWCDVWMKRSNIPITGIYPHRAFWQTSCPGKNVPDKFGQFAVIQSQISLLKKMILWLQSKKII